MKQLFAFSRISAMGLLGALCLCGCALTKDYVTVAYIPQANVARISGADKVKVQVSVSDLRSIKDRVSAKKNGYGMEMAAIINKEDVADTLKRALEAELSNRGFAMSNGDVLLLAELSKFWNDFKIGFWSGDAVAELTMNVQIKRADGSIAYSKAVTGGGTKPKIQMASGENAKTALNAALQDAVAKVFSDPALTESLLKASKEPQAPVAAGSRST